MTAAETHYADGTPRRTPGFNRAAWEGDAALVAPLERQPIGLGDSVAMKTPVDDNGEPVVRGIVLWVDTDEETGEQTVAIAREVRRATPDRRYSELRWDYRLEHHPAGEVDPSWHIQATKFNLSRPWIVAGQIAIAVGTRHAFGTGTRWTREDMLLIGGALQLADLEHHLEAS